MSEEKTKTNNPLERKDDESITTWTYRVTLNYYLSMHPHAFEEYLQNMIESCKEMDKRFSDEKVDAIEKAGTESGKVEDIPKT